MENLQESSLRAVWMKARPTFERLFFAGLGLMAIYFALSIMEIGHVFFLPFWFWIQLRVFVWLYSIVICLRIFDAYVCQRCQASNSGRYSASIICAGFSLVLTLDAHSWELAFPFLMASCITLVILEVQCPRQQYNVIRNMRHTVASQVSTFSRKQYPTRQSEAGKGRAQRPLRQLPRKVVVYWSGRGKDKLYADELNTHLQSVERLGIEIWDETNILPGTIRQQEIEDAIASAGFVIVLISPDLVASRSRDPHLSQILQYAESEGAETLILYVRSCLHQVYGFDKFQPINLASKSLAGMSCEARNKVYVDLLTKVCSRLGVNF
jgi:TIR domain